MGPILHPWGRLRFKFFLLWRGLDFRLVLALGISLFDFCFAGSAERFLALQRFLGFVGNRAVSPALRMGLGTRSLFIPAAPSIAARSVAAAAALFVAVALGSLLRCLW